LDFPLAMGLPLHFRLHARVDRLRRALATLFFFVLHPVCTRSAMKSASSRQQLRLHMILRFFFLLHPPWDESCRSTSHDGAPNFLRHTLKHRLAVLCTTHFRFALKHNHRPLHRALNFLRALVRDCLQRVWHLAKLVFPLVLPEVRRRRPNPHLLSFRKHSAVLHDFPFHGVEHLSFLQTFLHFFADLTATASSFSPTSPSGTAAYPCIQP